jgi:hypothetical protein
MLFLILFLSSCGPKVYQFAVSPPTAGPDDSIKVRWHVKGTATLLIHDLNYPGSNDGPLAAVTLIVTRHGRGLPFTLNASDTIKIPLESTDSLIIQKQSDLVRDDRLRYLTMVASLRGKEANSTKQVAIRPDTASDVIAFRTVIRSDSLIAEGINNPVRWGNNFNILTVASGSNRALTVTHAGKSREIPAAQPGNGFEGTPVRGFWSLRTPMTAAEKSDAHLIPVFLKLSITIKHQ